MPSSLTQSFLLLMFISKLPLHPKHLRIVHTLFIEPHDGPCHLYNRQHPGLDGFPKVPRCIQSLPDLHRVIQPSVEELPGAIFVFGFVLEHVQLGHGVEI